jgi:hypothetical protein
VTKGDIPYKIWWYYTGCEQGRLTMASDEITMLGDGGMVLAGRGVDVFRAYAVAKSLILYKTTGMKMTRTATPKVMMTIATQITGKKFPARDYLGAAQALMDWADEVSQSIKNKE